MDAGVLGTAGGRASGASGRRLANTTLITDEESELRRRARFEATADASRPRYLAIAVAALTYYSLRRKATWNTWKTWAALGIGTTLAYLLSLRARSLKNRNPPDAPPFVPLLGHTLDLARGAKTGINKMFLSMDKTSNFQTYELRAMDSMAMVVLHDAVDRRYVLSSSKWENFQKNVSPVVGLFDMMNELLGKGIFVVDGDEWLAHRKIAANMFSSSKLERFVEEIVLRRSIELSHAWNGHTDVQRVFQAFTFDVICEMAMGIVRSDCVEYLRTGEVSKLAASFDAAQRICMRRGIDPRFVWETERAFNIGAEKALAEHIEVINSEIGAIIRERRKATTAADGSLLALYMKHASRTNQPWMSSDEYLRDVVANVLVAGRDTTASTLTSCVRYLFGQSDRAVLNRLCAELPDDPSDVSALKGCVYLEATINEVLRLAPPVPANVRIATEEDTLPSSKFVVEKGTRVHIPTLSIGRDPSLFKHPNAFNPSRWIDDDGAVVSIDENTLPIFWAGPRRCLGQPAARLEVKTALCVLLKKLDFITAPIDDDSVNYITGPVLFYEGGVQAHVRDAL